MPAEALKEKVDCSHTGELLLSTGLGVGLMFTEATAVLVQPKAEHSTVYWLKAVGLSVYVAPVTVLFQV